MMYTDEKNAQIVLALLKKYGIKKIVVSPGMTNVPIARSVQQDSFFEVYSVVDERSAAYFATGLAFASGEPVVISCTGATASRNYLPALTEAYYRNLPIIALTSQHNSPDYNDFVPQRTDRSVSQNDVKRYSAMLPVVKNLNDYKQCVFQVNKALNFATAKGSGPVHINLPITGSFTFNTPKLPNVTKIEYYNAETIEQNTREFKQDLKGKKIGVMIGAHTPFTRKTLIAINKFVSKADAVVFYDQTSCYTGKNRVLTSQIADLRQTEKMPQLVVDLGSISGDYSAPRLFRNVPTWRVSEDGEYHNRRGEQKLEKVFECSEEKFFKVMTEIAGRARPEKYYSEIKRELGKIEIPTLPLSNTYVAMNLAQKIPKGSFLHLGILNSLRNMNLFELNKSIIASANVGGFGIDGPLSTLIGQAAADKEKLAFGLVGDLAFFYDMNALGIRSLGDNVRILLVNNGRGVEFRLNERLEKQWGSDTDEFIAAAGHNGDAQAWAEAQGFKYLSARTKAEFDEKIDEFCSSEVEHFKAPVVFEVFTDTYDEQQALERIRNANRPIRSMKK